MAPGPSPVAAPTPTLAPAAGGQPSGPLPGEVTPLHAPTDRPDEPLTAGLATGAGPGAEALEVPDRHDDPVATRLRAAYARYPSEDLRRLIEFQDADT